MAQPKLPERWFRGTLALPGEVGELIQWWPTLAMVVVGAVVAFAAAGGPHWPTGGATRSTDAPSLAEKQRWSRFAPAFLFGSIQSRVFL